MAQIMCTQKLWRALGRPGRPPLEGDQSPVEGATLGNWAAKAIRVDDRDLVLALNERTYLTVVFPMAPTAEFYTNFGEAVRSALQDLGVPEWSSDVEAAAVEGGPLVRLTDRSLTGTLNDLGFHCAWEIDGHADLRKVQYNLNAIPHVHRSPCEPALAVMQLFGRMVRPASNLTH